ncbi:hypothetical protein ANCCAN_07667 [Ancylostoma caninum]|uniref:Uncharacterized protein n=1 Tax=Ancylostoma caninum TaxID=29170 RepID=A0A368GTJ2_ANCCA|nr:hypothetical protein ANCCAN_07667 [Ancylostoma caninum]
MLSDAVNDFTDSSFQSVIAWSDFDHPNTCIEHMDKNVHRHNVARRDGGGVEGGSDPPTNMTEGGNPVILPLIFIYLTLASVGVIGNSIMVIATYKARCVQSRCTILVSTKNIK